MRIKLLLLLMLALTGCAWAGTITVTWDAPLYYDTDIVPPIPLTTQDIAKLSYKVYHNTGTNLVLLKDSISAPPTTLTNAPSRYVLYVTANLDGAESEMSNVLAKPGGPRNLRK